MEESKPKTTKKKTSRSTRKSSSVSEVAKSSPLTESTEKKPKVAASVPEKKAKVVAPKKERKIKLKEAAPRFIVNYKDHWWDMIRKHADNMGFGNSGTEAECKAVFKAWGATIK